jgi:hypothetical protein
MKVYLRLLLFLLYDTNEGLLKIFIVLVYDTNEGLLKIITVLVIILSRPSLVSYNKNSNNLKQTFISVIQQEQ